MNFQVFGCPNCEQPFQVSAEQAGQVVQCPSCAQQVEIPQGAFGDPDQPTDAPAEPHQVFACPNCTGQFGITPEMLGQQVGCPHCQSSILIQSPEPDPESLPPQIVTDRRTVKTKNRRKPNPKSATPDPEALKDLFAPGFAAKSKPPKSKPPKSLPPESKPPKSDLPDARASKAPPTAPETPKNRAQPSSQSTDTDQAAAKDKQRWRSPKKRPTKKKPPATDTPASQPVARRPDAVPPKVVEPGSPQSPAPGTDPKSGQSPPKPSVELYDHPNELPVNSAAATRSDIVVAGVVKAVEAVEAVEARSPAAEQPAQVDARTVSGIQQRKVESSVSSDGDKSEVENGETIDGPAVISEPEIVDNRPEPIDHLLPPRFDVLDPSQMAIKASKNQFKVLLPDGKGGMAEVDERVVRVEHEGERVSLVKMTSEQKARRRLIQNIIAIIVGIAMMGFAFWMLT